MNGVLERYRAEQAARRAEVAALSPGLRRDLARLCVLASHPDHPHGITESRGREILACSVTEFRELIRQLDPAERAPDSAPAEAAVPEAPRMRLPEGPELEGITAALAGWAGTHNPYVLHPGREADRDVWTLGFQLVQDFADERAHRAVQADRSLGQVGLTEPVDLPPALPLTSEATLWFVMRTHLNLARQRLIWQRESSLRINDSRSATIYNHAANIVGEELEATARYGPVAAQPALEVQG